MKTMEAMKVSIAMQRSSAMGGKEDQLIQNIMLACKQSIVKLDKEQRSDTCMAIRVLREAWIVVEAWAIMVVAHFTGVVANRIT